MKRLFFLLVILLLSCTGAQLNAAQESGFEELEKIVVTNYAKIKEIQPNLEIILFTSDTKKTRGFLYNQLKYLLR